MDTTEVNETTTGALELEIIRQDPVAYLRTLGIDSELVAVVQAPVAPAA